MSDKFEQEKENFIDKSVMPSRKSENLTNEPFKLEHDSEDSVDRAILSASKSENLTERPVKLKRERKKILINTTMKSERDVQHLMDFNAKSEPDIENLSVKTERDIENSRIKTERPGKRSAKTEEAKQDCAGETEDADVKVKVKEELDIGPVVLQHTDMALMQTQIKMESDVENDSVTNMNASSSSDDAPLQPRTPLRELNISIKSKKSTTDSKWGNYECDICSTTYKMLKNFKKHLKIHTLSSEKYEGSNKIKCDKCPSQFGSVHNFRKHHKQFHTSESFITYTCDICQNNYTSKCNLRAHIKLKHNAHIKQVQTVSCPQCPKVVSKSYLRKHIKIVHLRKRNKKCDNCNTKFMTQLRLDIHKKTCKKTRLYCEICKKYYCNIQGLNDHNRNYHNEKKYSGTTKSRGKKLCHICGKSFSCTSTLNKHARRFHLKDKDTSKLFQCDRCHKCFATNKNVLAHMARTSCTLGPKLFQCDKCTKSFVTKRQLLAHKTTACHTGPTVPCDLCHRTFKCISYLSDHKRIIHAHLLPYSCDRCSATYRRKDYLIRHVSKCVECP